MCVADEPCEHTCSSERHAGDVGCHWTKDRRAPWFPQLPRRSPVMNSCMEPGLQFYAPFPPSIAIEKRWSGGKHALSPNLPRPSAVFPITPLCPSLEGRSFGTFTQAPHLSPTCSFLVTNCLGSACQAQIVVSLPQTNKNTGICPPKRKLEPCFGFAFLALFCFVRLQQKHVVLLSMEARFKFDLISLCKSVS